MRPVSVSFLGAGDAFCARGRHQAAYLVQAGSTSFLLDCGATTLAVLQRTPSLIPAIDTILISHLHGDHFAGIPFLLLHYTYDRPRRRALRIAGPPGTEERVWSLFRAMYQDAWRQPLPFALEFIEMPPGVPRTIDTIGVEPFRVPHQENEVSLGLTVNVEGRRILYSGDTGWTEELVARSENTDLFICECCFFETRLPFHLDYPRLAENKDRFGTRRLILTHLGREVLERRDQVELELAGEGMIVEV